VAGATGVAACDQGEQSDQRVAGPFVHVVSANVGPDKKLAANDTIQIAFDRMLLPATIVRQSFVVVDSFGQPVISPLVTYDPITRVVTLSNPTNGDPWLLVDQPYKVIFPVPKGNDDQSGVRAIDRATLDPSTRHEIGFQIAPPLADLPVDPPISFCRDVSPILQTRCSTGECHGTAQDVPPSARFPDGKSRPSEGLVLETSIGVLRTAIGRASNEANTGPLAGPGRAPGRVFGVDMPIVAPGNPSNSWLMYKLLLAAPQDPAKSPSYAVMLESSCNGVPARTPAVPLGPTTGFLPLPADERARLANHMRGSPMPFPPNPGNDVESAKQNLTFDELERVRSWITQGALVEECACTTP
jgi:hypothetical protein